MLSVGDRTVIVRDGRVDNEAFLRSYLALVGEAREQAEPTRPRLRQDDIEVLAALLDLDDAFLERRLTRLLRVGATEAADLRRRMLKRRLLVAAGTVTVGLVASMPIAAAGGPSAPTPAPATAVAAAVAPDTTPPQTSTTTPTTTTSTTTTTPASEGPVEIGDALVIERDPGQGQPVEIGDALVIERDTP